MNNNTNPVRRALHAVFGSIHWRSPPWARKLAAARRERPRRFWAITAGVVLLPLLVLAGYQLWQMLPQPVLTHVEVDPPGITRIGPDGKLYPQPVTLTFEAQYKDARREGPRGAARLDLLGKTVSQGVALAPALRGEWRWVNENTLRFQPDEDWPAGQSYEVALQPSLLAEGVRLARHRLNFTTPEIRPQLKKLDFYQNPQRPSEHRVVATLRFTHAVDETSLKSRLRLAMRRSGQAVDTAPERYDYELRLSEHGREAYVATQPLTLPPQENFMTLTLGEGVTAADGPSQTDRVLTRKVRIPAVSTFFRVKRTRSRIVRNEDNDPEQTLLVEFTDGVKTEVVADGIQAWVLPDGEHWTRDEIDDSLRRRSRRLRLEGHPTERDYAKLQSFRFQAPEGRQILVHLPAGLVSEGGFEMTVPYTKLLETPSYPREARIVGEGTLLAMTGDRRLSLQARGVPALRVELFRLFDEQITHLLTQTRGDLTKADFRHHRFTEDNLGERFERVHPLTAESPAEAAYASMDMDPFLEAAGRGVFVVRVQGWDSERERPVRGARDRRLLLVTDLSVIAKDNADGTHDLFVQSLGARESVAGAQIVLLGRNGLPVADATTDSDGHARLPDVSDFDDGREPTAYLVRHAGDLAFLPFDRSGRKLNFSRFDVGGVRTGGNGKGNRLRAAVFSDRGIYRPGESGHLGIMTKRDDWRPVDGVPVEVTITNPRGNVVREERVALPADGFFELPFEFSPTDPTGAYRARVFLLDDRDDRHVRQLGETTVSVEEFQPDSMRIRTGIEGGRTAGWRTLDEYQGTVSLENLFGLPAQQRRVQASYTLQPTRFRFERYPGFVFEDPFRAEDDRLKRSVTERLPEAISDANGEAAFDIDLSRYGGGLFRLTFAAEGYEPGGGRSVSARSTARVSPAERLVGWKADGDLDYLRRGSERNVSFVVLNPRLESVAADDLTMSVVEKRPVSTLVRQDDGTLAYQTITKRIPVSEDPITIAANGSDWRVPTGEPGEYAAELRDDEGRLLAQIDLNVVGARNLAGRAEKSAGLGVKLDRSDYRPGEEIELQIIAPYAGAGLITIERDKVYAYKWFRADTGSSVQRIRLPEGLEGNGYVNVALVRSLDSEEIFTQPLSYAVAPFNVDRSARTVEIDLDAPEKVKPGEALEVGFRTSRPARIVVFAVDEGILQVADYDTPAPLDRFLRKRALEVETAQMADLLMPEFRLLREAAAAGGGEAAPRAALDANLNPFQRGVKAPVVYWSGIMEAGADRRSVSFTVPDHFDGQLRLMAVASAPQAAGSADDTTLVRGPFVLQPNVVTTAAPGDEFEVSVGVTNALPSPEGESDIEVRVEPSEHLTVVGDGAKTLTLQAGREGRARFRVRAGDRPGAAELVFQARAGEQSLSRTATLSVRPAVPHRTTLSAGMGTGGDARVTLARRLRPALAEQEATVGYSPLILVHGLRTYLGDYPHTCTEQLVSRALPMLVLLGDPAPDIDREAVLQQYRTVVGSLRARQRASGGFGFWPGSPHVDALVTVYAMHFLTDAGDLGIPVPAHMRTAGLDYLRKIAAADPAAGQRAYEQAYAIYVMTRNGRVTTNYLTRLQEYLEAHQPKTWRRGLVAVYMAAAYRQLKLDDLARDLVADYRFAEPGTDYPRDMDSALARNAQYVYVLARHFPERLAVLDDSQVTRLVKPITEGDFNTLSSAYTALALGAWGRGAGSAAAGRLTMLGPAADDAEMETLAEAEPPLLRSAVPLGTRRLRFRGDEERRLFHTVTQSGYDAQLPDRATRRGLEVVREYLDEQGEPVTRAPQGSELTVRIRLRALDNIRHDNVALVDLLPGGFEVQRESVRDRGDGWSTDYTDIREDRVVLYGSVDSRARTFTYRVKVTGTGTFVIPPAFAESMYHPDAQAQSLPGTFHVERP